ncbi:MAG TPA: 3D-(3,5/4)-trihydroxycyclohexane-1,2-dione acylhydrolase (decyclizing) [Solirubrobacteraceae bacterium]|nr:3D-(3,5/4)-trihydroxycyclohexane-1,2-dione acylhydrolase (decyclizing) [Solirubrobacteraceae bacterium]
MPDQTVRLTTGQALVRWLQAQWSERDGVRRRAVPAMFGIFGHGQVLGLGQALAQEGAELPFHQPKNEQAMVHTAMGYAKAARRLQALACTASIGPGATNMLTGAATATVNRLPVLLLPADTFASRRAGVVLQQLEHPLERDASVNDAFRPLSRLFDRIARPEQLIGALPEAMRVLLDPAETGAVTIALHQDVLGEAADFPVRFFAPRTWRVARRAPDPLELADALALLRAARRPLVIAGGGVVHAEAEDALLAFARRTGAPVAETSAGKGAMPPGPLALGGLGVNGTAAANRVAAEADLVLCVGTRLSDFTTGSHSLFQHPDVRFVGINVCAADAYKLSAAPVVADARLALEALGREAPPVSHAYRDEVEAARAAWEVELAADLRADGAGRMTQGEVYATVNAAARAGDWVIAAAGWAPGDVLKAWRVVPGSRAHVEFGFSCMAHEIPAALGVRMHEGEGGEIFVLIGDGTYLMGASELVTAVQEQWKLTVVVLDNSGYGSIDALARGKSGVSIGNEFLAREGGGALAVDYAANAASFGCRGRRADDADALADALADARDGGVTTVIHCPTAPGRPLLDTGAFWDLGVPEAAGAESVRALAAAHLAGRERLQRRY